MLQPRRVDWSRGPDEEAAPAKASRHPDGEDRSARARPRKQMGQKRDRAPTWSGAAGRAGFGAAIFFILLILLFKRPVVVAFLLSAFMFLIYIPMGHALDRFMYRRRLRSQARQREERAERKTGT